MPYSIWDTWTTQKPSVTQETKPEGRSSDNRSFRLDLLIPLCIAAGQASAIITGPLPIILLSLITAAVGIVFRRSLLILLCLLTVCTAQCSAGRTRNAVWFGTEGSVVKLTGELYRDSRSAGGGTVHYLSLSAVETLKGTRAAAVGRLLVFTGDRHRYSWGTRLTIIPGDKPGLHEMEKGIIFAEVQKDSMSISMLKQLRVTCSALFQRRLDSLDPRSAALLEALIAGNRPRLSGKLNERFRSIGTSHLLALSGMHLAVLAAGLSFLMGIFMPVPAARRMVLLLLPFYLFFTGPQPSLLRSAFMMTLFILTTGKIRRPAIPVILIYTYIFMLLIRPEFLQDQGFCFSFAALGGILFFAPPFTRFLARPLPYGCAAAIAVSAAAWCGTLPLSLYFYGVSSPVGIAASLVLTPVIWLFLSGGLLFLFMPPVFYLELPMKHFFFYLYELLDAVSVIFLRCPGITLDPGTAAASAFGISLVFFFLLLYSWYHSWCRPRPWNRKTFRNRGAPTGGRKPLEFTTSDS